MLVNEFFKGGERDVKGYEAVIEVNIRTSFLIGYSRLSTEVVNLVDKSGRVEIRYDAAKGKQELIG